MRGLGETPDGVGEKGRGLSFPDDTNPDCEGSPREVKLVLGLTIK